MIFLDAVAYVLQKEGNRAAMKETGKYGKSSVMFSVIGYPSTETLYLYMEQHGRQPYLLPINDEILQTNWEAI